MSAEDENGRRRGVDETLETRDLCDERPSRKDKARAAEVQRRRHRRPFIMTALLQ